MRYLETKEVPLAELQRFPGNARIHAEEDLQASVKLGQYKSLTVRLMPDGSKVILAGNGTADALEAVGAKTARIELIECDSDHEARSINLRDNNLSDKAKNDDEALAALIEAQDGDYEALGWTDNQIAKILGQEQLPDPGDAPTDDDLGNRWGVIVECTTEDDQVKLLEELGDRGLNVRAIMG